MSYPISHLTVRDTFPESRTVVVGEIYPLVPEVKAVAGPLLEDDDDDETEDNRAESKVVRSRGRRPGPKATETAETK